MSPRPYRSGKRQIATEETRARIVQAARAILAGSDGGAFTIDAVAERADVARMTVYYQFKSKAGLLEALFDDFGTRADMSRLLTAFQSPDLDKGLDVLVEVFCRLWQQERALLRRLNALAALDPEIDRALRERGEWRHEALAGLLGRFEGARRADEVIDVLHALTSFAVYDLLAVPKRPQAQIVAILQRAARAIAHPASSSTSS